MRKRTPLKEAAEGIGGASKLMRDVIDPPSQRHIREMMQPSVIDQALETRKMLETFSGRNLIDEAIEAKRTFATLGGRNLVDEMIENRHFLDRQLAGIDLAATARSIAGWGSLVDRQTIDALAGTIGAVSRAHAWAAGISAGQIEDFQQLYTAREFARVYAEATALTHSPTFDQVRAQALIGGTLAIEAELAATQAKMAMLAGAQDLLGAQAAATAQAEMALLGQWHTRPDLPQRFWRDPELRERLYEEAEVDPGLAASDAGTALQVMISGGYAAGTEVEGVSTAVIAFADINVTIQARGSRSTAYRALAAFEERFRKFIAGKLQPLGPKWFEQRVDGEIVKKAKETRLAAYKAGEPQAPLIDFTDLGELVRIVLRKDNWDQHFGAVFVNRDKFIFDTQAVIATRRPTMHSRSVDGVRLLELLLILQRLADQMQNDGAWIAAAEADE